MSYDFRPCWYDTFYNDIIKTTKEEIDFFTKKDNIHENIPKNIHGTCCFSTKILENYFLQSSFCCRIYIFLKTPFRMRSLFLKENHFCNWHIAMMISFSTVYRFFPYKTFFRSFFSKKSKLKDCPLLDECFLI